jgi:hypothetical protein
LKAENAALRHQLIVLQRKVRGRVHLLFFIQLYRWFPSVLKAITTARNLQRCGISTRLMTGVGRERRLCEAGAHPAKERNSKGLRSVNPSVP